MKVFDAIKVVDILKNMNKDFSVVGFNVDDEGIKMKCLDDGRISYVSLDVKKDYFEEFEGFDGLIVIELEYLKKLKYTKKASAKLECDGSRLIITINESGVKRNYKIPLLNEDEFSMAQELNIPDDKYSVNVVLPAKTLLNEIKNISSDAISLKYVDGVLRIYGKDDLIEEEVVIDNDLILSGNGEGSISVMKDKFVRMLKLFDDFIILRFGSELPLNVKSNNDIFKIDVYIAPRIEE